MVNSKFLLNETEKSIPYCLFYDCAGVYVPSHWHKEIEIVMCKKGTAKMVINNATYELQKDDVVIVADGDTHLYFRTQDHERLVILFNYQLFDCGGNFQGTSRKELRNKLQKLPRMSRYWSEENRKTVRSFLEEIEKLNHAEVFGWDLAVRAKMFELIFYLCNYVETTVDVELKGVEALLNLEKVFTYVEENYRKQITLEDVAKTFGFSTSYFARFFKKYSGETFFNYLNAYRINKARDILLMDNQTISRISEEVGILNVKTFNRLFKQIFGTSPTQYRKSVYGLNN